MLASVLMRTRRLCRLDPGCWKGLSRETLCRCTAGNTDARPLGVWGSWAWGQSCQHPAPALLSGPWEPTPGPLWLTESGVSLSLLSTVFLTNLGRVGPLLTKASRWTFGYFLRSLQHLPGLTASAAQARTRVSLHSLVLGVPLCTMGKQGLPGRALNTSAKRR